MTVSIRPYQQSDHKGVVALWDVTFPPASPWHAHDLVIARKLARKDDLFLVGDIEGQIAATVMGGYDGVRGWIYHLAVAPDRRQNGIGRQMVDAVVAQLRGRGCPKINLQVLPGNPAAEFYERIGFQSEERLSFGLPLQTEGRPVPADPVPTLPINEDYELSQVTWADGERFLKLLNESDSVSRYLSSIPFPYTPDANEEWLSEVTTRRCDGANEIAWGIRKTDGEILGECWLMNVVRGNRCEIGYWLADSWRGRGITPLAARTASSYAFEMLDCHKVYATIRDGNEPSRRVLEKAGFTFEATLKNHTCVNDQLHDVHHFGLWRDR